MLYSEMKALYFKRGNLYEKTKYSVGEATTIFDSKIVNWNMFTSYWGLFFG